MSVGWGFGRAEAPSEPCGVIRVLVGRGFGRAEAPSEPRGVIRVSVGCTSEPVCLSDTRVVGAGIREGRGSARATRSDTRVGWLYVRAGPSDTRFGGLGRGRAEAPSEPCGVIRVLVGWGAGRSE